jgi:Zn-dependent protease with chaperone function
MDRKHEPVNIGRYPMIYGFPFVLFAGLLVGTVVAVLLCLLMLVTAENKWLCFLPLVFLAMYIIISYSIGKRYGENFIRAMRKKRYDVVKTAPFINKISSGKSIESAEQQEI